MDKNKRLKPARRRISFALKAPDAQLVALVGNFNGWNPKKHPMAKNNKGTWQKTILLEPGTYEYKFWVDEQWIIDNCNDYRCPNTFGTLNNLIAVSPWKKNKATVGRKMKPHATK
jgi:5'-AMP-activated protein kinase regulatory beta subunit